ncbi:hypothetical protein CHS0354_016042 [Potamilus streckersoni]|uniref:Uncharacterized protein n=1 Tax=Potamilus streckersoni TaxID=2493646 RepID=A0AAE0TAA5_9BIVA|nr:hypothetical protein CHS0354_016042 [Potamilus streckersoni]
MGPGFILPTVLLIFGMTISIGQTLDRRIFEQCYGSMWNNYLTASCDTGQVISIISLQAFAKRRDTGCPQEETAQTPLPSGSCCRYNESDCGDIYLGDGLTHYLSCNGRQDCTGIPIAWMDTPCHTGQYLNKTNYMRMEYECVPSIGTVDLNLITTNNTVHIWNPKYPDGNTFPPGYTWTCSVEASCQTTIVVTAMFLQFLKLASGVCGQRVTIEENVQKKEISCESNNNYNRTEVYTSSSHFIKFTVNNNVASNRDWRFWFRFKGDQNDSYVTIGCGSYSRNSANIPSPGNCSAMSSTQTPLTSLAPVPANSGGQNGNNNQGDKILLIAILVPLAVLLIIVIVVVILCCRESIAQKCCYGQTEKVYPDVFDVPVTHNKTAPIATTLGGDKKKSLIRRATTHSLSYSNADEMKGHEKQRKLQLRKHATEMQLLKSPLQKRSLSSLQEKKSKLPAIFGISDHEVDAELMEDVKEERKERKRRKKEKKRRKLEAKLRLLEEEQQMYRMGYDGYVPNRAATGPFRVAGYAASAFRPPVMRPYYPGSGQENYYIPVHNMYEPQLPLAGSVYGYPATQHQNLQNIPVNGTASVRSTSTPASADGNSRDAHTQSTFVASSLRGTPAQPIPMTSSFRGASVQPSMTGSFRVPLIQRKSTLTGAPVSMDGGYHDEPINVEGSFHGGQIPMDGTFRGAPSLHRHPSAMSYSQRAGEAPLIFHTGQSDGQFVPQGYMYEPYENPALSRWRSASRATHLQTGGPSLEIGSNNPNEGEGIQVYDV